MSSDTSFKYNKMPYKRCQPKNSTQESRKNGLRSATPTAVKSSGAHKSVSAFSCLRCVFLPESVLCNTNRLLFLSFSAVTLGQTADTSESGACSSPALPLPIIQTAMCW